MLSLIAEKKGRAPAPRWYISAEELDSLSSLVLNLLPFPFWYQIQPSVIMIGYEICIPLLLQVHEGKTDFGKG